MHMLRRDPQHTEGLLVLWRLFVKAQSCAITGQGWICLNRKHRLANSLLQDCDVTIVGGVGGILVALGCAGSNSPPRSASGVKMNDVCGNSASSGRRRALHFEYESTPFQCRLGGLGRRPLRCEKTPSLVVARPISFLDQVGGQCLRRGMGISDAQDVENESTPPPKSPDCRPLHLPHTLLSDGAIGYLGME